MIHLRKITSLLWALSAPLWIFCSGEDVAGGGSGTETVGQLVTNNGEPVSGARVLLTSTDTTVIYDKTSDSSGVYRIPSMETGTYSLFAYSSDTALITFRDGIIIKESSDSIGIDTLQAPGTISGVATVKGAGVENIAVSLHGTSFNATTDATGSFIISAVLPARYVVSFLYIDPNSQSYYRAASDSITVCWNDTTFIDSINLTLTSEGFPEAPISLSARFDTVSDEAVISWTHSSSPDRHRYRIYRLVPANSIWESIAETADTFFVDAPLGQQLACDSGEIISYRATTLDTLGTESTHPSPIDSVRFIPRTALAPSFSWDSLPAAGDTVINGKPVTVILGFNDIHRGIDTIVWHDLTQNSILKKSLYNSITSGSDTLLHPFPAKGSYKIAVEFIDNGKISWPSDTIAISVADSIDFRPSDLWVEGTMLNQGRREHCGALINDHYVIAGGMQTIFVGLDKFTKNLESTEMCSFSGDSLSEVTLGDSLPKALRYSAAVALDGIFYLIGGLDASFGVSDTVYAYNTLSRNVAVAGILPRPLFGATAVVSDEGIFILGGADESFTARDEILFFNPSDSTVSTRGYLMTPRVFHASAMSSDEIIYTVGGISDLTNPEGLSLIETFNPSYNGASFFTTRENRLLCQAVISDQSLIIMGGLKNLSTENNTVYATTEILDLQSAEVSSGTDMPIPLHSFSAVVRKGVVYITGGSSSFSQDAGQSKKTFYYFK